MDVDPNSLSWAEKLAMMLETGQGQAKALGLALESATLDLRIDYLQPAEPDRDVFAGAEVYKVTSSIAFLRATAFQTEGDPIANAVATFMLGANAPKYNARQG